MAVFNKHRSSLCRTAEGNSQSHSRQQKKPVPRAGRDRKVNHQVQVGHPLARRGRSVIVPLGHCRDLYTSVQREMLINEPVFACMKKNEQVVNKA